uniref:Sodium channel modifier 1 n=1 Tax=Periophthalmus magnuspinnatus TaxID=409849 RepID=A0A3B4AGH3_9GOBI
MSFKREGDDRSQLNVLKKRRVADLLSNYIPEDEATIMSNGRYTCLVCSYGPVFDTVDMLTVHRNGKRHLEGLKRFYRKKAQLRNEIVKRKHESYIQSEENSQEASSSAPLLAQTRKLTHHALLRTIIFGSNFFLLCFGFSDVELHLEESPPMSEQRKKELEHYLKLKSAGWIQDRSGQWLKDDNVEFDSDEEEPPSLPT